MEWFSVHACAVCICLKTCATACNMTYTMCNSRMWIWRGQWWKRKRQCMLLCRSMFSDQPKTHACLRVREKHWVWVCVGRGRGLVITVCMFVCVCVCRRARAARGVRGGRGMLPDGDCKANWETGHCLDILSIPLTHVCLSHSPAWCLGQWVYLLVQLPYNTFSTLLRIGVYRHEERADKSRLNRQDSPSLSSEF